MLELVHVHILAWIFGRHSKKQAEEAERRRERFMHPVRFGVESQFPSDYEDQVMATVEQIVREHVSEPETAEVTDYTFYGPTEYGVAVCVEMESTNVVRERATNHFVVLVRGDGFVEGCLICDSDPRVVREG